MSEQRKRIFSAKRAVAQTVRQLVRQPEPADAGEPGNSCGAQGIDPEDVKARLYRKFDALARVTRQQAGPFRRS